MSQYSAIRRQVGSRAVLSLERKNVSVTESKTETVRVINSTYKSSESTHTTSHVQIVEPTPVMISSSESISVTERDDMSTRHQSIGIPYLVKASNKAITEKIGNSGRIKEDQERTLVTKRKKDTKSVNETVHRNQSPISELDFPLSETSDKSVRQTRNKTYIMDSMKHKDASMDKTISNTGAPVGTPSELHTDVNKGTVSKSKIRKNVTETDKTKSTSSEQRLSKRNRISTLSSASKISDISAENKDSKRDFPPTILEDEEEKDSNPRENYVEKTTTVTSLEKVNESTGFSGVVNSVLSYFTQNKADPSSETLRYNLRSRNVSGASSNGEENNDNVGGSIKRAKTVTEVVKNSEVSDKVNKMLKHSSPMIELVKRNPSSDHMDQSKKRRRDPVKTRKALKIVRQTRTKSSTRGEKDIDSKGKTSNEREATQVNETSITESSLISDSKSEVKQRKTRRLNIDSTVKVTGNESVSKKTISKNGAQKRKNPIPSEDLKIAKRVASNSTDQEESQDKPSYFGGWGIISRFSRKGVPTSSQNSESQSYSLVNSVVSYFTKSKIDESGEQVRYNLRNRNVSGSPVPTNVHYSYHSETKNWSPSARKRKSRAGSGRSSSPVVKRRRTKRKSSSGKSAITELHDTTEDELVALVQSSDDEKPSPSGLVLPTTPKGVVAEPSLSSRKPRKKRVSFSERVQTSEGPPYVEPYSKPTPSLRRRKQNGHTTDRQIAMTKTQQTATGYDGN